MKKNYRIFAIILTLIIAINVFATNELRTYAVGAGIVAGGTVASGALTDLFATVAIAVLGASSVDIALNNGETKFGKVEQALRNEDLTFDLKKAQENLLHTNIGSDGAIELTPETMENIQEFYNYLVSIFNGFGGSSLDEGYHTINGETFYFAPSGSTFVDGINSFTMLDDAIIVKNTTGWYSVYYKNNVGIKQSVFWSSTNIQTFEQPTFPVDGYTDLYSRQLTFNLGLDLPIVNDYNALAYGAFYEQEGSSTDVITPDIVLPKGITIVQPNILPNIESSTGNKTMTIPTYLQTIQNYYNDTYVTQEGSTTYEVTNTNIFPTYEEETSVPNKQPITSTFPLTPTVAVPTGTKIVNGLGDIFPFCIPFDLVSFFEKLDVPPQAPSFDFRFYIPDIVDYTFTFDFSMFDTLFLILRKGLLILFILGLILMTKPLVNPER